MLIKRWHYGLKYVHPTFYMAGKSEVCSDLRAGAYSYLGPGCRIGPKVEIEPYVMLAPGVSVIGGDHRFDIPGVPIIFSGRPELKSTVIEADAWIGTNAIILAGIRIGRGAIVGAGAVVNKDIPSYEIYGGVPAKKIGDRFSSFKDQEAHDTVLNCAPKRGSFCLDKT